jgi:hypothetical protein
LVNKSTFGNNQRVKQEKRQQQLAWIILWVIILSRIKNTNEDVTVMKCLHRLWSGYGLLILLTDLCFPQWNCLSAGSRWFANWVNPQERMLLSIYQSSCVRLASVERSHPSIERVRRAFFDGGIFVRTLCGVPSAKHGLQWCTHGERNHCLICSFLCLTSFARELVILPLFDLMRRR